MFFSSIHLCIIYRICYFESKSQVLNVEVSITSCLIYIPSPRDDEPTDRSGELLQPRQFSQSEPLEIF